MADIAFSVDIQDKVTRIGDVRTSGAQLEVLSLGVKPTIPMFLTSDNPTVIQNQAQVITQLVESLKIKKKVANVILPDGVVYSQITSMPALKEKELLSAIRYQSDEFIPMPIDETNLDIEIIHEDSINKKLLVLIVAAPKKLVVQVEKTLELAGLTPGELINELTAAGRLITGKMSAPKQNATLIINIGWGNSSLYLVDGKTSLIIFARTFKIGLELFNRDVKVNANVDDARAAEMLSTIGFATSGSFNLDTLLTPVFKEFAQEVEKFIALSKERYALQVDSIKLFNYDNKLAHLDKKLTEHFSVNASSLTPPLVQNPVTQSFAREISSFISVIGASL